MIYDTFLYDGEDEILDLRIATLGDVVDMFIPIFGVKTFRGICKSADFNIRFLSLRDRFYGVPPLVVPASVPLPSFRDPFMAEQWHRNHALAMLPDLKPDDIVLIGDVDEIPDPDNVGTPGAHVMDWYCYDELKVKPKKWTGTVGVLGETILNGIFPSAIRSKRRELPKIQGGWHLSCFYMDPVRIREKIRSSSHWEFDQPQFTDLESILTRMNQGLDLFDRKDHDCVILTEPSPYLPAALRANPSAPSLVRVP